MCLTCTTQRVWGRVGFPGGPVDKVSACHVGDPGLIPGLGSSPGERNGNPLQYSCLENSMHGGAWKIPWMEEPGKLQSMGLHTREPITTIKAKDIPITSQNFLLLPSLQLLLRYYYYCMNFKHILPSSRRLTTIEYCQLRALCCIADLQKSLILHKTYVMPLPKAPGNTILLSTSTSVTAEVTHLREGHTGAGAAPSQGSTHFSSLPQHVCECVHLLLTCKRVQGLAELGMLRMLECT